MSIGGAPYFLFQVLLLYGTFEAPYYYYFMQCTNKINKINTNKEIHLHTISK